ncbi:MAG: F0F1 ATP synthase subunit B [Oscillospiraceae bacterium]|nr:F0F1 ATP synthase subunit B [Oscillospiraceae bacterium]
MDKYLDIISIDPGTILFTLINTLVIMLMYRFFLHAKVVVILDKRKAAVSAELDAAEAAKVAALEKEAEYKLLLENSKAEAEKILNAANSRALAKEREILAEANINALHIREKAEEGIALEKKRVMNEIKNQISELVIMTASAVAEKEIGEKDNETLINSFLVNV